MPQHVIKRFDSKTGKTHTVSFYRDPHGTTQNPRRARKAEADAPPARIYGNRTIRRIAAKAVAR